MDMDAQVADVPPVVTYALWNNKGGVGKTTLTFQLSTRYAHEHPEHAVLVVDLSPQSDVSALFFGGYDPVRNMSGQSEVERILFEDGNVGGTESIYRYISCAPAHMTLSNQTRWSTLSPISSPPARQTLRYHQI